jgi:transketolase
MAATATADATLCVNTIRTLSIDAIEQAGSGHPGLPLGMAPAAYLLYAEVMQHDPKDPMWPDRDRFVLSAGHGSMLLYSTLHLAGYELGLEELKRFRQWESLTPGHPERDRVHVTPGVEVTTGPLGQGFANGVGMAIAEQFLRERYGSEVMDHHVYAIVSDGDLMEGIAAEAASLAGQLKLGRLIYLYDDNDITLDGPASLSFSVEDRAKRFEAYGWQVCASRTPTTSTRCAAIGAGKADEERPTLIDVKSIIGYPSPTAGHGDVHGKALGEENVRKAKEALGWDPRRAVPRARRRVRGVRARARRAGRTPMARALRGLAARTPSAPRSGTRRGTGRPMARSAKVLPSSGSRARSSRRAARRQGHGRVRAADADDGRRRRRPHRVDEDDLPRSPAVHEGARGPQRLLRRARARHGRRGERHGRPRRHRAPVRLDVPAVRRLHARLDPLSALTQSSTWPGSSRTTRSRSGEDGPTHQPVEHLARCGRSPGLVVLRPGDATRPPRRGA